MQIVKNLYTDISIETVKIHRDNARDLPMRVFKPQSLKPGERRSAVVFWFGGGFYKNDMDHFYMQSEYFAHRGMIVFTPDYRLTVEDHVKIPDCLYDGRCALEYVLMHAEEFGADARKVVVSGGSAGGMIAAAAVVLTHLWKEKPAAAPCAMVLFNPVLEMMPPDTQIGKKMVGESGKAIDKDAAHIRQSLGSDMQDHPEKYSCLRHIEPGMPPVLMLQGMEDPLCETVRRFAQSYRAAGNYIEVEEYPGCTHGFFNPGRSERNFYYEQTKKRMEMFLLEQGLIQDQQEEKI